MIKRFKNICTTIMRIEKQNKKLRKSRNKKIYLFGVPFHNNLGDQAQTYCTLKWCEKYYPDRDIFYYETTDIRWNDYALLKYMKPRVNKTDLILLHSGYHTTDLYMLEEDMQRNIIHAFPENKIVVLPQTILYQSKEEERKSVQIYNSHHDITLLCRDEYSYETANRIFKNCNPMLYPDIVTTLIGIEKYNNKRSGILFCVRNDKEAFYSHDDIVNMKRNLTEIDDIDITDTTLPISLNELRTNRKTVLKNIFNQYSKYKLIITDRYHGTIFSLVSNTPVLVLKTKDHKVSSGVKWFQEAFHEYIKYVDDISKLSDMVKTVYNTKYSYNLPEYFNEQYYSKLKNIIGAKK